MIDGNENEKYEKPPAYLIAVYSPKSGRWADKNEKTDYVKDGNYRVFDFHFIIEKPLQTEIYYASTFDPDGGEPGENERYECLLDKTEPQAQENDAAQRDQKHRHEVNKIFEALN